MDRSSALRLGASVAYLIAFLSYIVVWRVSVVAAMQIEAPVGIRLESRVWDPLESTCRHASLSIL